MESSVDINQAPSEIEMKIQPLVVALESLASRNDDY